MGLDFDSRVKILGIARRFQGRGVLCLVFLFLSPLELSVAGEVLISNCVFSPTNKPL